MTERSPLPGAAVPTRVPWIAVVAYIVIALGLAWLVALPLWAHGGLQNPMAKAVLVVIMYTPAAAALVVLRAVQRPTPASIPAYLGLWPRQSVGRMLMFCVIGIFGGALLVIAGVFLSAALGFVHLDLVHFSGFRAVVEHKMHRPLTQPAVLLVAQQVFLLPVAAMLNTVLAIGEELGWRGWLLPSLRPLGTWPALVLSGAIWGLWHAPIILLGYNFDEPNLFGVAMMTGGCTLLGILFGFLRLRTASVWPAAFAHGAVNAAAGFIGLVAMAGTSIDPVAAGPLGWVTWIVMGVVIAALAATGQFRMQPQGTR